MWYASLFDAPNCLPEKDLNSMYIGTKKHPRHPMSTFIKKGFYSSMTSIDNRQIQE